MRHRLMVGVAVVSALLAWAPDASGQSGSSIAGVVRDTTGAVLPGVTVEASSPALIEKTRTVVTDGAGLYKIVDLRPGAYAVAFTLSGFSTAKHEGIELTASFTATVNAELRVGSLTETVTVSGETPTVDIQNVVQQRVVTRDIIDAVPVSKTVVTLGAMIPGVTASNQDVGGSAYTSSQISIHGSRPGEQQLLYDGMYYNNGQGRGGTFTALAINDGTVQEISLETGGLGAESEMSGIRTNIIPKEGGNTFKGSFFGAFTNHTLQSDNLTDALKARGLASVTSTNKVYDINPSLGGPIKQNTLWFFASYRKWVNSQYVAGMFYNLTPTDHVYTPDLSRPALADDDNGNESIRLTWQASRRNKVSAQYQLAQRVLPGYGYFLNQLLNTPEATQRNIAIPDYLAQAGWSSPVTGRLLLEAGAAFANKDFVTLLQPGIETSQPAWTELSTGISWGSFPNTYGHNASHNFNTRVTASYVTGSHAVKVGTTFFRMTAHTSSYVTNDGMTYQLNNGNPSRVTVFSTPLFLYEVTPVNLGIFAQDQWTVKRLTANLGIRFDYLNSYVPAQNVGPGPQVPTRNVDFAKVEDVPNWKNTSPRIGGSYDLFGNGKTAIKASLGRYLEAPNLISYTRAANPANAIVTSTTRTWNDSNRDFVPQPGELGPLNNVNFGRSVINTRYDPEVLTTRGYNWELATSVQHELAPRVSANVGYFRRWYGNQRATQNVLVTPADYNPYCITAPRDARLPDGGGYQVCGLYDISVAKLGQSSNVIKLASNFGDQKEIYNGVDVSLNARLPGGFALAGGTSTGRVVTDSCFVVNSPQDLLNCRTEPPFMTQIKLMAVYPLPWWGLQTSLAFQSLPGPQITASYAAANALIAPTLGRNLATCGAAVTCNGTATVPLIAPGTMYGDRLNQLDFRGSKILRLQRWRLQLNVDLYNMLNVSPVIAQNNNFGSAWQRPTTILQGRLVKFGAQVDF